MTPWTAACQASLSITNSRSLIKLMSIQSVMPSNHLILCHPLLFLPSIFPIIRVFSNESVLRIRWPKYWSFSFSISPSDGYIFSFSPLPLASQSLQMVTAAMKLKDAYSLEGKLDSIFKSRDITLSKKVHIVKATVFPVVVYRCESWTIKRADCQRFDVFKLWCWRGLLRVPWTARRPNQSILKEISPGCSLEGLMLKLKLQYFGQLMRRADSFEKTLMLGKIEGRRRKG